jgi:hypothetical protein
VVRWICHTRRWVGRGLSAQARGMPMRGFMRLGDESRRSRGRCRWGFADRVQTVTNGVLAPTLVGERMQPAGIVPGYVPHGQG